MKTSKVVRLLSLALCLLMAGSSALAIEIASPGVLPIVTEPITFTVMAYQTNVIEDWNTCLQTLKVEERTGINLDFTVIVPDNEFNDKMNLMVAAGGYDLPDLVIGNKALTVVMPWGQAGAVLPLNEYYENNTYWMDKTFQDCSITMEQGLRYLTCYDGNIYGLISYGESVNNEYSSSRMVIYEPWLIELGLEVPQSTDELLEVLRAFRDGDPNGNGLKDEIPLTSSSNRVVNVRRTLMTPFVYTQNGYYLPDENGTMSFAFTQDGWREGMRYVKQLIDEGLLDPAFLTQDIAQLTAQMGGDVTTVGAAVNISTSNMSGSDLRRYAYVQTKALAGPDGTREAVWQPNIPQYGMLITKNCKEPLVAFQMGDFLCSEEMALFYRYGVEGVDFKRWEPGDPSNAYAELGHEQLLVAISPWGVLQNTWWSETGPMIRSRRVFFGAVTLDGASDPVIAEVSEKQRMRDARSLIENIEFTNTTKAVPTLIFNEEESEIYSDIGTVITTYVEECWARFITSDLDLDKDWDSYLKELNKMGLDTYLQAVQSCYDRMYK